MKKLLTALLVFVMLFSLCAFAVTLDTAESAADVKEVNAAEIQATEVDISLYDPMYGQLVYYNNFEGKEVGDVGTGDYKTYHATNLIGGINITDASTGNPITIVKDPKGTDNKVLNIAPSATGRQYPQIYFSDGSFSAAGVYTIVFDVIADRSGMYLNLRNHVDNSTSGHTYKVVSSMPTDAWTTVSKSYDLISQSEDGGNASTYFWVKNTWMHSDITVPADADPANYGYYLDNVRIYYLPKGAVTEESLNLPLKADGTKETVYKTPSNSNLPKEFVLDTTKTNYISLADTLYIPGYSFLGWYDENGVERTTSNFTVGANTKILYAKWQKVAPGLNMLTGTTEAADFENGSTNNIGFWFNASNIGIREVVDNSFVGAGIGNTTNVLRTQGIWTYHHMFVPGTFESGRQYEIKYDAYYSAAPLGKINTFMSWIINTGSTINHTQYGNTAENKAGKWYTGAQTITPKNSVDYLEIQTKITSDSPANQKDYTYQYIYFDNMSVMPYYKVTYKNVDGSDLKTEWLLKDADGNVLTSFVPDAETSMFWTGEGNKLFAGWSTVKNDTAVVESIALANEDIVLYPVFEDVDFYAVNSVANAKTNAETEIIFTKAVNAEATTAVSTTGATVTWSSGNKCVVKGSGYSGILTLNLVFADGTTATEEIELIGGDKWKPGLNIITGTTDVFDFEGYSDEETAYALTLYNNAVVTANPKNDGLNTSASAASLTNSQYPGFTVTISEIIEKDRSLLLKYDYKGTWDSNVWLLADGAVYANFAGQMSKNSEDWRHSIFYFVDSTKPDFDKEVTLQIKLPSPYANNALFIDNVAFIPAYKFTYVDVDGTENVVYAIHDENGNLLTSYTPDGTKFASGVTSYKLSEDGEVYSIDTPIALANDDVIIYAVADAETPGTVPTQEIRFDVEGEKVVSSIRFKGFVSVSVQNKASEYGFIATRKMFLDTMVEKADAGENVETELTFDFKYGDKDLFAYGAAYAVDENGEEIVNKSVGNDADGNIVFAAVLSGIANDNADQVNEIMVARPYVKFTNNGKQFVFYGANAENSLVGVAKAVDITELPENEKNHINAIIALEK